MLIIWATYVLAISTLLVAAAWVGERVLQSRRRATRFVWAAAFVGSFLSPVLGGLFVAVRDRLVVESETVARLLGPPTPARLDAVTEVLRDVSVAGLGVDALFLALWVLLSGAAFLWFWRSKRSLVELAGSWRPSTWQGEPVLVSDDMGPSVVGFLSPRLVIPTWVAQLSKVQQELVLEHELEHLRMWDPRFSQLSLVLVCLMPWNLPLVAAYRRLRLAIEIDCDRRVVRRKGRLRTYGRTLLQAHSQVPAHGLGFLRRSELEQRIRCLVGGPSRWVRLYDGLAVFGTAAAVLAFALLPLPRASVFGFQTVMGAATPHPVSFDEPPELLSDDMVREGARDLARLTRRLDVPVTRVTLFVRITEDGAVDQVYPGISAGNRAVDALARRVAYRTRWRPAREDGRPKSVWVHFDRLEWGAAVSGSPPTP